MNTIKATRWMVRLGLPLVLVGGLLIYRSFGLLSVPRGMDTMPDTIPGGSTCVIQKRPSRVTAGAVVFVDLADGSTVLTRVHEVLADGDFEMRHDNRESAFSYLEAKGPYSVGSVRGLVLTTLISEVQGEPRRDH